MFLTVSLDILNTRGSALMLLPAIITSAASIAISVPVPMAMPVSAQTRAGESFMPSPTIATVRPSRWSFLTISALSAGLTSYTTFSGSIPSFMATNFALASLSPLIMNTSMLLSLRALTTSSAPDLSISSSSAAVSPIVSVPVLSNTTVSVL